MAYRAKPLVMSLCSGLLAVLLTATAAKAGWQLTFSDEFDGDALDQTKWKVSDIWNNGTLSGNGEQQCYVPEGVKQSGGVLLLTAQRFHTPASSCKGANSDLVLTSPEW